MANEVSGTKQNIRRADILLIGACLVGAVILSLWFALGQKQGSTVRVSFDGTEIAVLSLDGVMAAEGESESVLTESVNEEFPDETYCLITYPDGNAVCEYFEKVPAIPEGVSYNLLHIVDGKAVMEAADCKDQICVRHKPISADGETIICLPHKLAVEIECRLPKDSSGSVSETSSDGTLDGMVK